MSMKKLREFAEKLNGRQYLNELTKELEAYAKENGIVVVYGQSDDLMEVRGAIDEEFGCWDGGEFWVSERGEVFSQFDLEDLHKIPKGRTDSIEALWDYDKNFVWTYKTDIPHETFDIMEDDEPYCKGIVFYLKDLKPKQTNFDKITESVESLAEFIDSLNLIDCNACVGKSICDCHIRDCKDVFIKWLQEEVDDEEDK